jgi:hypothetical protein
MQRKRCRNGAKKARAHSISFNSVGASGDQLDEYVAKRNLVNAWDQSRIMPAQYVDPGRQEITRGGETAVSRERGQCGRIVFLPTERKPGVLDERVTEIECEERRHFLGCLRHVAAGRIPPRIHGALATCGKMYG